MGWFSNWWLGWLPQIPCSDTTAYPTPLHGWLRDFQAQKHLKPIFCSVPNAISLFPPLSPSPWQWWLILKPWAHPEFLSFISTFHSLAWPVDFGLRHSRSHPCVSPMYTPATLVHLLSFLPRPHTVSPQGKQSDEKQLKSCRSPCWKLCLPHLK